MIPRGAIETEEFGVARAGGDRAQAGSGFGRRPGLGPARRRAARAASCRGGPQAVGVGRGLQGSRATRAAQGRGGLRGLA